MADDPFNGVFSFPADVQNEVRDLAAGLKGVTVESVSPLTQGVPPEVAAAYTGPAGLLDSLRRNPEVSASVPEQAIAPVEQEGNSFGKMISAISALLGAASGQVSYTVQDEQPAGPPSGLPIIPGTERSR